MPKPGSHPLCAPDNEGASRGPTTLTQLPDLAAFSAALNDHRVMAAVAIAAISGLVRGFSGFGSALIYMPLVSAVYGPRIAAPTLLLIDTIAALPFALHAMPQCNWREVTPVSIAAALALPLGVIALVVIDPLTPRWFIAVLVLVALATLVSGWRYHGKPTLAASFGGGALAGFGGGAVQIGAPPLLVFWLGSAKNAAVTVRANIMVYFIMQGALSCIMYFFNGLFTAQAIALTVLLGLPFAAAMAAGVYWFHGASDAHYRRVAYVIIGLAALVSMPIFDSLR